MPLALHFYIDESGTRNPDRNPGGRAAHNRDWFSLGGILILEEDEDFARQLYNEFCGRWPQISHPLHSSEIRGKTAHFQWLSSLSSSELQRFLEELYSLMKQAPVLGLACVIDRPGYNIRYADKREQRWLLCKTAFCIATERAAKLALSQGRKLRIFPERCSKADDALLKTYYSDMRTIGLPFDQSNSDKYRPLSQRELKATLYDFKMKHKSSPLTQLADLYLWPLCIGGYHKSNRTYARLVADGKLVEHRLVPEEIDLMGSKYSCFEGVSVRP